MKRLHSMKVLAIAGILTASSILAISVNAADNTSTDNFNRRPRQMQHCQVPPDCPYYPNAIQSQDDADKNGWNTTQRPMNRHYARYADCPYRQ